MKKHIILFAVLIGELQSGCVVGRRTVVLPVPTLSSNGTTKGNICISSVEDNRVFQNKPPEPSTPSIDGDVTKLSASQKLSMIGRQRNNYGKAMGDIALPSGDTITQRARILVEEGFKNRGYKITSGPSAENLATISVDEFWGWFTPNMWSATFEARVYFTLTLKKADSAVKVVIKGYGMNRGQVVKDANWQLAYDRAFHDFLDKFKLELDKTPF